MGHLWDIWDIDFLNFPVEKVGVTRRATHYVTSRKTRHWTLRIGTRQTRHNETGFMLRSSRLSLEIAGGLR